MFFLFAYALEIVFKYSLDLSWISVCGFASGEFVLQIAGWGHVMLYL